MMMSPLVHACVNHRDTVDSEEEGRCTVPYQKPDKVKLFMYVLCRRWEACFHSSEQSALVVAVFVYAVGYEFVHVLSYLIIKWA